MAYNDPTPRHRDTGRMEPVGLREDPRYRGESEFRTASGYRQDDYADDYPGPDPVDQVTPAGRRRRPAGVLDDVFDDPEHGDPGRDRLAVHLVWEGLLLAAVLALAVLLYNAEPDALRGAGLDTLLVFAAALGLLALGAGLTLRTAAPNLALGPTAMIAALYFAHEGNQGVVPTTATALAVALAAGLALAVLVIGFHVPAWGASLAVGLAAIVWIEQVDGPEAVTGDFDPAGQSVLLFGGFAVLAVLGGLLGAVKPVRRAIGRFRPVADPARRRGVLAAGLTGLALVASMGLAAVAGVLFAAGGQPAVAPSPGLDLTGLAIGAALLGGTSAYGRRGGIFGTLLAVIAITLFIRYDEARDWDISTLAVAAAVLVAGLLVTRLVEAYGRPERQPERLDEDGLADTGSWVTTTPVGAGRSTDATADSWSSPRDSWTSALPAQPTGRDDRWDSDPWRSR